MLFFSDKCKQLKKPGNAMVPKSENKKRLFFNTVCFNNQITSLKFLIYTTLTDILLRYLFQQSIVVPSKNPKIWHKIIT